MELLELQKLASEASISLAANGLTAVVLVCERTSPGSPVTNYYMAWAGDAFQVAGLRALAPLNLDRVVGQATVGGNGRVWGVSSEK